jgi:hypothetical protein
LFCKNGNLAEYDRCIKCRKLTRWYHTSYAVGKKPVLQRRDWGPIPVIAVRSSFFLLFRLKADKHFLISVNDLLKDKVKTPLGTHSI